MALIQDGFGPEPGGSRDEQVGHLRQIGDQRLAGNFLAESHGNIRLGVDPIFRLQDIADEDGLGFPVGHFNPDAAFTGYGGEDAHGECLEPKGDILVQREESFPPAHRGPGRHRSE